MSFDRDPVVSTVGSVSGPNYEADGFDVEVEYAVGQSSIDVYAESSGEVVAVEVARSPEHELENVKKCLDPDVDRVEVAYLDEDVVEAIHRHVYDAFGGVPSRVEFVPMSEYV